MGRRSGVHPCQDPLGPAAHLRTDAPRGGSPDRQRRAVPGGADQAVRHPAGVLGARRRSGHPHHKTQAPGHRGHIRPTSSSPCTPEPARRRKPAELTPVAMPVLKSPGRTARRRQPPILSEPTSWHDRNRAEPNPMRAASRPEGMMATAPESAGFCCMRCKEIQITNNAQQRGHGVERGIHYQAWREQSVNVGGYSSQAAHCQRSRRNTVRGQRGIGAGRRLSSSVWLYACPA